MKTTILSLSLLALLAATSCKKDKEEMTPLTKESIAGNYILTQATAQSGSSERDVTEFFLEDCERDDIIQFKTDMTFEVTDNGVQCDPPTEETGPWALPGNNKISIDGDEADVKKWDGKELHFSRSDVVDGQNVTVLFKMRKQ